MKCDRKESKNRTKRTVALVIKIRDVPIPKLLDFGPLIHDIDYYEYGI